VLTWRCALQESCVVKAVLLQADINNAAGIGTAINDCAGRHDITDVVIGTRKLGAVRRCAPAG